MSDQSTNEAAVKVKSAFDENNKQDANLKTEKDVESKSDNIENGRKQEETDRTIPTKRTREEEQEDTDGSHANKKHLLVAGKEESKVDSHTKPVYKFGASSGFSSGFGSATSGKSVFGSFGSFGSFGTATNDDKKETSNSAFQKSSAESKTPEQDLAPKISFGKSTAFGAGFGVLKKPQKGFLDTVHTNNSDKDEKVENDVANDKNATENVKLNDEQEKDKVEKQKNEASIQSGSKSLTEQEVKSGEEDEIIEFQSNAKLYELVNIEDGWKERGVGPLHVNKSKKTGKLRIIMRSKALLNVILNLPLVKGFQVHKGFCGSVTSEKFIRILAVNEDNKPVQYAIKVGKVEIIDELVECINSAIH